MSSRKQLRRDVTAELISVFSDAELEELIDELRDHLALNRRAYPRGTLPEIVPKQG